MNSEQIAFVLGERPTQQREKEIFSFVLRGQMRPIVWHSVQSQVADRSCIIMVASDAVCVGDPDDFFRVNVCHATAQKIADFMGLALPTSKVSDLIHQNATVVLAPCTQVPDSKMAYTSRMLQHSRAVSTAMGSLEGQGLASTVGKDWVLTNRLCGRPDRAANYGWHVTKSSLKGPGGLPVLQPVGLAHDMLHVDYSQVVRLVHRWVYMDDGSARLYEDVLQDPEVCHLLSDEGPLRIVRHPGVPVASIPPPAPPIC